MHGDDHVRFGVSLLFELIYITVYYSLLFKFATGGTTYQILYCCSQPFPLCFLIVILQLLEEELDEAKLVAAEKTIEASCILKKFEEVQDTVKEADIMINELMIANEALKLSAHDKKAKESELNGERINLMKEVESLKLANNLKDQNYGELEEKYNADFVIMKRTISELEDVISEVQTTSTKEWMSVESDICSMKCQIHDSTESVRKLLEEVWSEIIAKDCAVSVLHLCHMGILLETVNGLNAENSLLHHGLCESNSVISELQEHNVRSRRELEMCRVLKGKLLSDIKSGFDRISSKVDESGEVTLKLTSFKKKIQDLQHQEEVMLQRSNDMGSELAVLMKELDLSNKQALATIMDQDRLLKEKDELFQHQEESFILELLAKDVESFLLSAELKQICLLKADVETALVSTLEVLEIFKKEIVFKSLDAATSELILHDGDSRNERLVDDVKMKESAIEISSSHISELQKQILNLQNDICLLETESQKLQTELKRKDEELGRLSCLEKENEALARNINCVEAENHRLQDNVSVLENSIAKLEEDLSLARAEIRDLELSQSSVHNDLCLSIQDYKRQLGEVSVLKEENTCLRNELRLREINESEYLNAMNLRSLKSIDLAETVNKVSCNMFNIIEEKFNVIDDMSQKIDSEMKRGDIVVEQFQYLENLSKQLDSEVLSLHGELLRKDDILKGLLFDMTLLQESTSVTKDGKDEKGELLASLRALENDLQLKSLELEGAAAEIARISARELDLRKENQRMNSLSQENAELLAVSQDAVNARNSMDKELVGARIKIENLELEVAEMDMALVKLNETTESLKSNLDIVTSQRDELSDKVFTLTRELEMARALADENEAIATEAQEVKLILISVGYIVAV